MPLPNETFDTGKPASGEDLAPELRQDSPGVAEGEDDGLILWMLSLTPWKRLEFAQGFADSAVALRNGRRT